MALRFSQQSEPQLKQIYERLTQSVREANLPRKITPEQQSAVRQTLNSQNPSFDHWFYGYWNADLEGMRVTDADLKDLQEKQIERPTGNYRADASLILLVRIAKSESDQDSIPAATALAEYDRTIRNEVSAFVKDLSPILK